MERTKFGEFVLSYRKKNREPQRVLAGILGTSMGYLCSVERGIYDIPFRWLDPIAKHFGMNEQESATLQKLAIEAGASYKKPRQKARLNEFGKIIDGLRRGTW